MKKEKQQRTNRQNKALHLFFKHLAIALNEAGLDMRVTLKPEIDIPWDENGKTIKEYLWRPVQQAQLKKESTTELTTDEINKIWETMNRHFSQRGFKIPNIPSEEEKQSKITYEKMSKEL